MPSESNHSLEVGRSPNPCLIRKLDGIVRDCEIAGGDTIQKIIRPFGMALFPDFPEDMKQREINRVRRSYYRCRDKWVSSQVTPTGSGVDRDSRNDPSP